MAAQSTQRNQAFCVTTSDRSQITSALFSGQNKDGCANGGIFTAKQNLLDLLKLESLKFCLKSHVHVILHIGCQVNIDYHNQHESAALIGLFHATSLVLPSVESYPNYRKHRSTGVPLLSAAESRPLVKVRDYEDTPKYTTNILLPQSTSPSSPSLPCIKLSVCKPNSRLTSFSGS